MLFNSHVFVFVFLPLALCGFFAAARWSHRAATLWLAGASILFYAWWDSAYVMLLCASIGFNFVMGRAISRARSRRAAGRRALLASAITANLLLLGYFKYANFFLGTAGALTGVDLAPATIVLPLGISFFTFTQIAFLVDAHQGAADEYSPAHYLLFVTYFPHLIAGPLLHHKQMMPQFARETTFRVCAENIAAGLTVFAVGLFKKVVLADQFALYANPVFDVVALGARPQFFEAWSGALCYSLQLYFDFSGYSDMAIGASLMFNIRLPLNFDSPYKAASIIDFWKRWHMTLSAFLLRYLYVPLGGNRLGRPRRYVNLMVTMLLGGLWHGASWSFVLWGGLHGAFLVVNHAWRAARARLPLFGGPALHVLSVVLTFAAVVVAWVPFRADSIASAARMLAGMAGLNGVSVPESFAPMLAGLPDALVVFAGFAPASSVPAREVFAWVGLGLLIVWFLPNVQQWMRLNARGFTEVSERPVVMAWSPDARFAVLCGILLAVSVLCMTRDSPFLYFQF